MHKNRLQFCHLLPQSYLAVTLGEKQRERLELALAVYGYPVCFRTLTEFTISSYPFWGKIRYNCSFITFKGIVPSSDGYTAFLLSTTFTHKKTTKVCALSKTIPHETAMRLLHGQHQPSFLNAHVWQ